MENIGILVHGRHVQAEDWETLMMGNPPEQLGSLSRLVLEILNRGPENIGMIIFGTGASERDGIKESECMKNNLCKIYARLKRFRIIKEHPRMQSDEDTLLLVSLINNIYCEVLSQNTTQEIINAAKLFEKNGCTEIYQISCGSHMPRCTHEMLKARARGNIPTHQRWYSAPDDMAFANSEIGDVVVLEPPHRGDDSMLKADVRMPNVIRKLFKIPTNDRIDCLHDIDGTIASYQK